MSRVSLISDRVVLSFRAKKEKDREREAADKKNKCRNIGGQDYVRELGGLFATS